MKAARDPFLEGDKAPRDFDVAKAELFEAISHPLRIRILEALSEKPMGFAELGRAVGIASGGHLSFHLEKLRHFVETNPRGDYALTADGEEALWTIRALQKSGNETSAIAGRASLRHRSLLKPTIAIIVIVLIALSGFGLYQQSEFNSQQQQIVSQQRMIGALEGGVPFTNGQPASLVIGQKDFSSGASATSQAGLLTPTAALFDAHGNLWVVDSGNNRVLQYEPPFSDGMKASVVIGANNFTEISSGTTSKTLYLPFAAAFDSSGNLWVADSGNNRILEYLPPFSNGMAASLVIGHSSFTDIEGMVTRDGLNWPLAISFDVSGDLWVFDASNARVLEYVPPFSNGMNASLVLGQPDFTSSSSSYSASGFGSDVSCSECGGDLALDQYGNVWVGDPFNNRILEFVPPFSNGMAASLVIDQQNLVANKTSFAGHGYQPGRPNYNLGSAMVFDSAGNLWAAWSNRILAFKPPFNPEVRSFPSVEIGQPNFTSTAWLGGQSGLFAPSHSVFDPHGNLWVTDTNNNRILEFVAGHSSPNSSNTEVFPGLGQIEFAAGIAGIGVVIGALALVQQRRRR